MPSGNEIARPIATAMAVSWMCCQSSDKIMLLLDDTQLHWTSGPAEPTSAIVIDDITGLGRVYSSPGGGNASWVA
jgi:hypothetical protein